MRPYILELYHNIDYKTITNFIVGFILTSLTVFAKYFVFSNNERKIKNGV